MRKLLTATAVLLTIATAAQAGEFHFVCESKTDTSKHVELRINTDTNTVHLTSWKGEFDFPLTFKQVIKDQVTNAFGHGVMVDVLMQANFNNAMVIGSPSYGYNYMPDRGGNWMYDCI
jgi:hypothetical protein